MSPQAESEELLFMVCVWASEDASNRGGHSTDRQREVVITLVTEDVWSSSEGKKRLLAMPQLARTLFCFVLLNSLL